MADMSKAYEMYKAGFSCGQIVATFLSEICGFDEKAARAALGGFGGGMYCGETCSAAVGAVYSLGMYCNHCEYNDPQAGDKIVAMTKEFTEKFSAKHGSLACRDLCKPTDLHKCGEYIDTAVSLVSELVERDREKSN
ncbi:MAG: C_GCAxxG_C_C family protein [Clostridiales bacterium]|jgi:C_GCAxxG_C_C family probable redox protein|nr:C_GCAxxG_C_C family protein [Clostridiales bacterium]